MPLPPCIYSAPLRSQRLHLPHVEAYRYLWDEINGDREGCSWAENPWVWCVEFRRVRP